MRIVPLSLLLLFSSFTEVEGWCVLIGYTPKKGFILTYLNAKTASTVYEWHDKQYYVKVLSIAFI